MRVIPLASAFSAFLLLNSGLCQLESTEYTDADTGITFQSYTNDVGISYRLALPEGSGNSDAILQIEAPNGIQWAALAWGGHMQHNPLTVAWPNEETVIASSRLANSYWFPPEAYDQAEYTYLQGTGVNETHWKVTFRCKGCTTYDIFGDGATEVDSQDTAVLAYAYSTFPVWDPADVSSPFDIHDAFGHWSHDIANAKSAEYTEWTLKVLNQTEGA